MMAFAREQVCAIIQAHLRQTDTVAVGEIDRILTQLADVDKEDAFYCAALGADEGFILGRWIGRYSGRSRKMMEKWFDLLNPSAEYTYDRAKIIFDGLQKQSIENKWTLGHIIFYFCSEEAIKKYVGLLTKLSRKIPPQRILDLLAIKDHQRRTLGKHRADIIDPLTKELEKISIILTRFRSFITTSRLNIVNPASTLVKMSKLELDEVIGFTNYLYEGQYLALLTVEEKQLYKMVRDYKRLHYVDMSNQLPQPHAIINNHDNQQTLSFLSYCLSTPDYRPSKNIELICIFNSIEGESEKLLDEILKYVAHLTLNNMRQIAILLRVKERIGVDYIVETLAVKPLVVPNVELENFLAGIAILAKHRTPFHIEALASAQCKVQSVSEVTEIITSREADIAPEVLTPVLDRLAGQSLSFQVRGTAQSGLLRLLSPRDNVVALTLEDFIFNNSDFLSGVLQIPLVGKFPQLKKLCLNKVIFNGQSKEYFFRQLEMLSQQTLTTLIFNNNDLQAEDIQRLTTFVKGSRCLTTLTINNKTVTTTMLEEFSALPERLSAADPQIVTAALVEVNAYVSEYPQCLLQTMEDEYRQALQKLFFHFKQVIKQNIATVYKFPVEHLNDSLLKLKTHARELIQAVERATSFNDLYTHLNNYIVRKKMREYQAARKCMIENFKAICCTLRTIGALQYANDPIQAEAPVRREAPPRSRHEANSTLPGQSDADKLAASLLTSAPALYADPVAAARTPQAAAAVLPPPPASFKQ
jgi:hypothetical protein